MVMIYVPCASKKEALRIGKALLRERLAGCANVWGPSESLWISESSKISEASKIGKISSATEYILLLKTLPRLADRVERRVRALHSYSVPCIARIKAERVNAGYAKWLRSVVG